MPGSNSVGSSDYWVHDLDPFILRFNEDFGLRWYGLSYVLGFAAAYFLLRLYFRYNRSLWNAEQAINAIYVIALGVIVGGRVGYVLLYDLAHFFRSPLTLFKVWEGGMASHGGLVGLALALLWYARKTEVPFLKASDIAVTLGPPGLFFGRIANFINGELWGKVTDVSWAVIFPASARPGTPIEFISPRHPSQLYEAALEGLVLLLYTQVRFWTGKRHHTPPGQLCGEFLLLYAIVRIIGEQFREPDAGLILGLSRGVFYSLFIALAGIVFIIVARRTLNIHRGDAESAKTE